MVLRERTATIRSVGKGCSGRRQQARLFFGEDLLHGAAVISRPAALMRDLVAPEPGLPIAFGQRGEGTAGPEGIANIADGAFHAPFLIAGADLAGPRRRSDNARTTRSAAGGSESGCRGAPARHCLRLS